MDRAAQADRQTLKNFEDECERVRRAELADERAIAIRERYRRERSAYGFDRLATRVVREARQGIGRRRDALQRLRAFAVGLGLGVFGLAALGAAGLIGPKVQPPQFLWRVENGESAVPVNGPDFGALTPPSPIGRGSEPAAAPITVPHNFQLRGKSASATNTADNPRCAGSSSEQGALASAALHTTTARPQYLGGGRSDQAPPGHAAPTHPAAVSMTPPGGGVAVAASIPSK